MTTLRARRHPSTLLLAAQLLITLVAASPLIWPELTPGSYTLSVAVLLVFAWSVVSWKMSGHALFSPYVLFLTSAFLFNAGHAFLEVFSLNDRGILNGTFDEPTTVMTLTLVLTGLSALHLGGLIAIVARGRVVPATVQRGGSARWIRGVGWLLVAIALPPTIIWLAQGVAIASSAGYGALYDRSLQGGVMSSSLLLSGWLVPGMLFLTVAGRTHRLDNRVATVLMLSFVLAQMYIGYRSTAVMPLIAWAWLRHRAVRPVKVGILALAGVVLVAIVFPLIRETRILSGEERSLTPVAAWFDPIDNPAVSSISEMGGSMRTIAYTTDLVPSSRPYDAGIGYGYAALTLVPNLFWSIHPTVAHGLYSDWLVNAVDPWSAARGGGMGFSFIAEAYLNFGSLGPAIVLLVIGFLGAKVDLRAEASRDPARLALVATMLAILLRFPRDESASILRPIIWYGVAPYLAAVWLPRLAFGAVRTVPLRHQSMPDPVTVHTTDVVA